MHINKLSVINFKNYKEAELEFSEHINCFVGNNGAGKTNLLDALYYLSFCKSYFNPIDSQNIAHEEPFFVVQGDYAINGHEDKIYCGVKRGQKKQFRLNKKEYDRLSDHIGKFPLVIISPADTDLISEGSDERRKFIDSVISQWDKEYLDDLINYNKVLQHRNTLLKQFRETGSFEKASLEIWDKQLITLGKKIHPKRRDFINELVKIFQQYHEQISGGKEVVSIDYESHLSEGDFEAQLNMALDKDRAVTHTTVGIHKDDLVFKIGESPIKKFGSQGQQKTFLVALKLAQFDFIKEIKKLTPILLLDDIFDKLDEARVSRLLELVSKDNFGQIFITDTHEERIKQVLEELKLDSKVFTVNEGAIAQ